MSDALIQITPPEILSFDLNQRSNNKLILNIKNISNSKIAFKVKTTQPNWYYVKPNQQLLDIGQSEDVSIILVENESARYLENLGTPNEEKLDKHRFLVQSKSLTEEEYNFIKNQGSSQQKNEEYLKLWNSRDPGKSNRLKVEFILPVQQGPLDETAVNTALNANSRSMNLPPPSPSYPTTSSSTPTPTPTFTTSNIDPNIKPLTQNKTSRSTRFNVGASPSRDETPTFSSFSSASSTPSSAGVRDVGVLQAEFDALNKKYDSVVQYTLKLTSERDTLASHLETTQRQLAQEIARMKDNSSSSSSSPRLGTSDLPLKQTKKELGKGGYSLFALILVAVIGFMLGRFVSPL